MPERVDKMPRWRLVKPLPALMIPKRALMESSETNRSKHVIKNTKTIPHSSDEKDSYKILLLIRELAIAQEREEEIYETVSMEKKENLKMKLELSRIQEELNESRKKQDSLSQQLIESSKIITHYEQEISVLKDQKPVEKDKTSIGVGTGILCEIPQMKTIPGKSDEKRRVDLDHFLKLCRQNELSISVAVDQSEKLDTLSLCSDSQMSLLDHKIQVLNENHQASLISACTQTQISKKVDNVGVQTDDHSTCSESVAEVKGISDVKAQVEATPEYVKCIMDAYANFEPSISINPKISAKRESSIDKSRIITKIAHKNPCFKTSPKNSICTCPRKPDSKSSYELSHSSSGLFLLQDETSMLVPLVDLLAELEESQTVIDTLETCDDSIVGVENQDMHDLSSLIHILNK